MTLRASSGAITIGYVIVQVKGAKGLFDYVR